MYKIIGGDHKEYGPTSADEVRRWIAEGRLSDQSLIQLEGTGEWKALAQYPEFADALAAQPGPAPAPVGAVTSANFQAWIASILARPAELRIGSCLSRGLRLMGANFGLFLAAAFVTWILGFLALLPQLFGPRPSAGMPAEAGQLVAQLLAMGLTVMSWVLDGVLRGGMCLLVLQRLRGQPAGLGEVFSGFRGGFLQLVLVGVVSSFFTTIGVCACCVGWAYLSVAWALCVPLAADKQIEFWTAMEVSRRVVTRVWFEMFVLLVVAFLPFLLAHLLAQGKVLVLSYPFMREAMSGSQPDMTGLMELVAKNTVLARPHLLASRVVLWLNLPFAFSVLMYAYEDLFGPRPTPSA